MTRLGGPLELPAANIQPKATGEDVEEEGTVASSRFPSRTYAVYVHMCPVLGVESMCMRGALSSIVP